MFAPAAAFAKPDFSRSTIALDPAAPKEGDVVTFLVHLRNTGDEPAPFTEVEFELPLEAMFVDVTGLDGAKVDPVDKVIAATIDLPAGADRQFTVRMVIPRDAGGRSLSPHLKVRYAHAGVEFYGRRARHDRHARRGYAAWCLAASASIRASLATARRVVAVSRAAPADGIAQGFERARADDRDRRGLPVDLRGHGLATTGERSARSSNHPARFSTRACASKPRRRRRRSPGRRHDQHELRASARAALCRRRPRGDRHGLFHRLAPRHRPRREHDPRSRRSSRSARRCRAGSIPTIPRA